MTDELVDDLANLTTSIVSKWMAAYRSEDTAPKSLQDAWMLWAECAGDMVQAGYLWMQLADRCCGTPSTASTASTTEHHKARRGDRTTKTTPQVRVYPVTETVVARGKLHATAF